VSTRPPDFDELVGDDLPAAERDRLLRVHDLLVQAGPPPDLPAAIAAPPEPPEATIVHFPRRRARWLAGIAAAAALALVGFGAGYLVGDRPPASEFSVSMSGDTGHASLAVLAQDAAGNWPMRLTVEGLPEGAKYELWLTRHGRLAERCGTFAVGPGRTEVPMNAPYKLKDFDGWVVVEAGSRQPLLTT
jgi:hypothetical protein